MATTGAQLAHTRVRPEPAPPRPSRYWFHTPQNPDRIDASPLLTSPQHPGGVNEQADLCRPCRAFIAAAFDGLREEHVPRPGGRNPLHRARGRSEERTLAQLALLAPATLRRARDRAVNC